jgi:hypothetical protein
MRRIDGSKIDKQVGEGKRMYLNEDIARSRINTLT